MAEEGLARHDCSESSSEVDALSHNSMYLHGLLQALLSFTSFARNSYSAFIMK
jgi:hypothetical protein